MKPGWRAKCVFRNGETDITITKTTVGDKEMVLNAQVSNSPRSVSPVGAYGVKWFFTGSGTAGDLKIVETYGQPIRDQAFSMLQNAANSVVPKAEFAGWMSNEIDADIIGPSSSQHSVDVAFRLSVKGTATDDGEDYLIIRRDGLMSGALEGQHIMIPFAGYALLRRKRGLIAEHILNTQLRASSASSVRENLRLSYKITHDNWLTKAVGR